MRWSLLLAAAGSMMVAPPATAGPDTAAPGEVTAVSVLPGPGRTHVVIDVRGSVTIQDFTLEHPPRLVIDVLGAKHRVPALRYDRTNRGGIVDLRSAQFRSDVVRIVLELDALRDYELEYVDETIRVTFGSDQSFQAWSSASRADSRPARAETPEPSATPAPPEQPVQQSQLPSITVTYDSANIRDVAAAFAAFSGKSIIVGPDVEVLVNATIQNQPWDMAFQRILDAYGLSAIEDPIGLIQIDSRQTIAARDSLEPLGTITVPVNYAVAADLVPVLQTVVSQRGNVVAESRTNSLIITDAEGQLATDSAFIAQLDIPTPQVSIQAKLIKVDRTDIEELGVKYDLGTSNQFFNELVQRPDPSTAVPIDTDGDGVPDELRATDFFSEEVNIIDLGGNALAALANAESQVLSPALELIFSTAIGNFNLTTFIDALQRVELADLQAEPLTTTADNTEAYILVGEKTPIRQIDASAQGGGQGTGAPRAVTNIVETGLLLRVTPHVTQSRQVLLDVRVENSSVTEAPVDVGFTFQTQEAQSQLLVNDGQTAVVGGLTVTEVTVAKSGIPFLVDLPIIGGIFGNTRRREERQDLLILVTPHILDSEASATRSP